jgi:hypothetical protein
MLGNRRLGHGYDLRQLTGKTARLPRKQQKNPYPHRMTARFANAGKDLFIPAVTHFGQCSLHLSRISLSQIYDKKEDQQIMAHFMQLQ